MSSKPRQLKKTITAADPIDWVFSLNDRPKRTENTSG